MDTSGGSEANMTTEPSTQDAPPATLKPNLFEGLKISNSSDEITTPVVSNRTQMVINLAELENVDELPSPPQLLPESDKTGNSGEPKKDELLGQLDTENNVSKSSGGLFGWLMGTSSTKDDPSPLSPSPTQEEEATVEVSGESESIAVTEEKLPEHSVEINESNTASDNLMTETEDNKLTTNDNGSNDDQLKTPPRCEMTEAEQKELDEAFQNTTPSNHITNVPTGFSGRLTISPDTPVPNADVAFKLLRKFAYKTRPKILTQYGGSLSRSIVGYLLTSKSDAHQADFTYVAYKTLLDLIFDASDNREPPAEEVSETEHQDDEPVDDERARTAMAAFVDLFSAWGHASSAMVDKRAQQNFACLQVAIMDAASNLVAYGCLDNVQITMNDANGAESATKEQSIMLATQMLAQSVFNCDLSLEQVELAAIKFLLGAGCRQNPTLLHGSHLLQAIRTLYHVFLTTESKSNKTTARAALQQLITSVFTKVVENSYDEENADGLFPSADHRDAFLVLRSLCKLSMRQLPGVQEGMISHIGLQTSASNDTWDGQQMSSHSERNSGDLSQRGVKQNHPPVQLIYTSAIHPALESKLLALELILYVLENVNFSAAFVQYCGPQFQSVVRNYLCVSLLKNCTSDNTQVVNTSLRIFVPVVRNFRTFLKSEIEAFVTNVFFVILYSRNSPAEHKSIVVNTFNEICSDPTTLAEIFLNYDCDLSAVDLFHRIVNTLSRLSRTGLQENRSSGLSSLMGGPSEAQMEKSRTENRELRLDAMRALRQILASLHASIVEPMIDTSSDDERVALSSGKQSLVEIYGSKKKRRAEESEAILLFNRKPAAGIAYAARCNHIDAKDPVDVARYLLKNKDDFDKTQIGEFLGREAEFQNGFSLKVLHEYVRLMDFTGLVFDDAIRFFLSGFRLPGEAQKIDRIMEKFAERFTDQNPDVFPSADVAFILSFSIIMLNTDLHNPAIKEDRRMTKGGFIRNNRGICDGQDLPEELLISIFDRIKANPISLKEDDEARERHGDSSKRTGGIGLPSALSPTSFFSSHYIDADRARETNFQKERDHIVRTTESLLKRRRHGIDPKSTAKSRTGKSLRSGSARFVLSADSGLRDEYVSPMFEVTWGPALAAFSTAMESANGSVGALIAIASDEELELAAENAAETIEVCLTGFRFAIGTAGLCGNAVARDAYMLGLSRFSQLGTGVLLEPRHLRCVQTMLSLAREDGELLGGSWEHVFKALSEINRFHQLFHLMARNDRAIAVAAQRRQKKLQEKEQRRKNREERKSEAEDGSSISGMEDFVDTESEGDDSLAESGIFSDEEFLFDSESMDLKAVDEANAREIYEAVSEGTIEAIYERSSSLSATAVKEFILQLCNVSRVEISVGVDHMDITQIPYRQKQSTMKSYATSHAAGEFHHTQPNIYNLQKLVEVTHYNMSSRPRMIFAELWVTVADHLTYAALHSNPAIAMYAVDSFRQISTQYLQRAELEVFEFQRRFLKPLETIMANCTHVSTKELLLNCVNRLMRVFGNNTPQQGSASIAAGGLKSGWIPILVILGLGGSDQDLNISRMSFDILSNEIESCLSDKLHPDTLLADHFVEAVDALQVIVGGPHQDISLLAIGKLETLTEVLVSDRFPSPTLKRKQSTNLITEQPTEIDSKRRLELWWPILLGLSRAIGDSRLEVRTKALESLFQIVNKHLFPQDQIRGGSDSWETLQLIYRGVLNSVLEYAESSSDTCGYPDLPDDFEFILNDPQVEKSKREEQHMESFTSTWLETTYDTFMDACVDLCLRSIKITVESALVEEVFALLNSCLLSDSGALVVRGLRRLEFFVSSDLDSSILTDDVWATISHMLQRCLEVRGLPKKRLSTDLNGVSEEEMREKEAEYVQSVREFTAEDRFFPHRRFIGSNATMVIGLFLCSERFSIGLRWRLFLMKWLHLGVCEWDEAADILTPKATNHFAQLATRPPDYRETAYYGRKWINRLVLQLVSINEIAESPPDADVKANRFAQGQKQVVELTEDQLISFVKMEEIESQYHHSSVDDALYKRYTDLVTELLTGYANMNPDYLKKMSWISPVLLSSCIRSKNDNIRLMVQKLVSKTSCDSASTTPYPSPVPQETTEVASADEKDVSVLPSVPSDIASQSSTAT